MCSPKPRFPVKPDDHTRYLPFIVIKILKTQLAIAICASFPYNKKGIS